jgi:hypothetical protein
MHIRIFELEAFLAAFFLEPTAPVLWLPFSASASDFLDLTLRPDLIPGLGATEPSFLPTTPFLTGPVDFVAVVVEVVLAGLFALALVLEVFDAVLLGTFATIFLVPEGVVIVSLGTLGVSSVFSSAAGELFSAVSFDGVAFSESFAGLFLAVAVDLAGAFLVVVVFFAGAFFGSAAAFAGAFSVGAAVSLAGAFSVGAAVSLAGAFSVGAAVSLAGASMVSVFVSTGSFFAAAGFAAVFLAAVLAGAFLAVDFVSVEAFFAAAGFAAVFLAAVLAGAFLVVDFVSVEAFFAAAGFAAVFLAAVLAGAFLAVDFVSIEAFFASAALTGVFLAGAFLAVVEVDSVFFTVLVFLTGEELLELSDWDSVPDVVFLAGLIKKGLSSFGAKQKAVKFTGTCFLSIRLGCGRMGMG